MSLPCFGALCLVWQQCTSVIPASHSQDDRLLAAGLRAKIEVTKLLLSQKHCQDRLDFAIAHQYHTEDDWKHYIWSDETKIKWWGSDGKQYVWVRPGKGLNNQTVWSSLKHSGGSVMVWGAMHWTGPGQLMKIEGIMDGDLYVSILKEDLMASFEEHGVSVHDIIFQHDNDPKHTCKKARSSLPIREFRSSSGPLNCPISIQSNTYGNIWSRGSMTTPHNRSQSWSSGRESRKFGLWFQSKFVRNLSRACLHVARPWSKQRVGRLNTNFHVSHFFQASAPKLIKWNPFLQCRINYSSSYFTPFYISRSIAKIHTFLLY